VVTSIYRTTITHARTATVAHRFSYRHPMWLVDLDAIPALPRPLRFLLAFDARDHLGDATRSIRANVDGFLAEHGVPRPHRVVMLANPRSFGHGFNPLTLYWPYDEHGTLHGVVAEVHNTYGGRHSYFIRPDADPSTDDGSGGRAETDKALYVSPFFPVDGRYEMQFTEPRENLEVGIVLRRDGVAVFRASLVAGAPRPVRSVIATALRHPLPSWWVSSRIRFQGVRLWLRGVPLVPRPVRGREPVAQEA
jgi:DUF1365 family protein